MTAPNAKEVAQQLGNIELLSDKLKAEIKRLNKKNIVTLKQAEVRDIFDKLNIAVVLVGTDRLDTVIKRDEQVYNRFRACYRFGKLSGDDFTDAIKIWERDILKLPVVSNLTRKSTKEILAKATGGYIGLLDMILREAAIRALKKRVGYAAVSAASRTT